MKKSNRPIYWATSMILGASLLAICSFSTVVPACAENSGNGGVRFAVIGDHRGDNSPGKAVVIDGVTVTKYDKLVQDPEYPTNYIGFKDGGINQVQLAQLAAALATEDVDFVIDIGDLVTKYIPQINGRTADQLLTEELALWKQIWMDNSGGLPIYPIRGNQEWTMKTYATWFNFLQQMPGIGSLPINGPLGEEGLTFGFTYRNCLFACIDQYVSPQANGDSHVITPAAQAWLEEVLLTSDKPFKFVFGHTPAFEVWNTKQQPAFSATKDGIANPYTEFRDESRAARDRFWNTLGLAGAEYFCGHEHIYTRGLTLVGDRVVRQTITGNGGAPTSPAYDPLVYPLGPFAESYTGIELPRVNPPLLPYILEAPRITCETWPRSTEIGYVIVEVRGSHATATYKPVGNGTCETWELQHYGDIPEGVALVPELGK